MWSAAIFVWHFKGKYLLFKQGQNCLGYELDTARIGSTGIWVPALALDWVPALGTDVQSTKHLGCE